MKRAICLLLSLVMALSVLVGCAGGNTDSTSGNNQSTSGNSDSTSGNNDSTSGNNDSTSGEEVKLNKFGIPMHEGVTLTIGMPENANVLDYYDNDYTKWLEEQTGIKLKFELYASSSADYQKQLSTDTVAGKKLPDMLMNFTLNEDAIKQYGDDGYFIDLSEFYEDEEKSKPFWDLLDKIRNDEVGDWEDFVDGIELRLYSNYREEPGVGPMYAYPTVATSPLDTMIYAPLINTKWLDVVGKSVPTTLDELVDVLRAFKNTDCNGDGWPNELPMIGCKSTSAGGDIIAWLVGFFMYEKRGQYAMLDDNGQVYTQYTSDVYRDALKFINSLVDEGLLIGNSVTYASSQLKTIFSTGDMIGVTMGQLTSMFGGTNGASRYQSMDLYGYAQYASDSVEFDTFITEDCENPEAAWDLLMTMSTWESAVRQRWGVEGRDWERSDGTVTSCIGGLPCTIKLIKETWSNAGSEHWKKLTSTFNTYDTFDMVEPNGDPEYMHRAELNKSNITYFSAAVNKTNEVVAEKNKLPYIRFNEDEEELCPNSTGLKNEMKNWREKFVTGDKDIESDADWAAYLAALESAGLQQYLQALQHCYDRMYPNGHVSN